ncbi:hypothetical protein DL237_07410 [Pseudooceanicola sediminis]|uniref:Uncharacterized protein n=1 Tax=Pseudooceanicola sediminis TaxID=2211117 RepID=A0A399J2C6_9RHOB|nr:hypothetical protein [Pseudooceanicola sediminis]KAA2314583.1 hypothetical protein E0K93_09730 [Puniceibacterium sp. HSS470]RII39460.1 hypothetical protein DL237_07410 [Pseudooceanicola sediminis]|tara:strand:+ start:8479 stop:9036 length:558 start_codon:yes stop_codon:yes gene_type:complete
MSLTVSPADRDAIYVLATDPEAPEVAAIMSPKRLNGSAGRTAASLLGLSDDMAGEVELVNPADLEGIGLSGYLTQGLGLNEEAVGRDKMNLDALRSPVILLRGRLAEAGESRILLPRGISYVGKYLLTRTEVGMMPLTAQSASGVIPPVLTGATAPMPRSKAWIASLVIGVGVVLALVAIGLSVL